MPVQNDNELKALLLEAYGGYADKRYKHPPHDLAFTIDDRAAVDYDAEGALFYWFCKMSVHIEAEDRVLLSLRGGVPESPAVNALLKKGGATRTDSGFQIVLTPGNLGTIDALIKAFSAIIKKQYETKAYKYVVPRACHSLARLKRVLAGAWTQNIHIASPQGVKTVSAAEVIVAQPDPA